MCGGEGEEELEKKEKEEEEEERWQICLQMEGEARG